MEQNSGISAKYSLRCFKHKGVGCGEGREPSSGFLVCLLLSFAVLLDHILVSEKNFGLDLRHTWYPLLRECVCVGIGNSLFTRISTSVPTLPVSIHPQILTEHLLRVEYSPPLGMPRLPRVATVTQGCYGDPGMPW